MKPIEQNNKPNLFTHEEIVEIIKDSLLMWPGNNLMDLYNREISTNPSYIIYREDSLYEGVE